MHTKYKEGQLGGLKSLFSDKHYMFCVIPFFSTRVWNKLYKQYKFSVSLSLSHTPKVWEVKFFSLSLSITLTLHIYSYLSHTHTPTLSLYISKVLKSFYPGSWPPPGSPPTSRSGRSSSRAPVTLRRLWLPSSCQVKRNYYEKNLRFFRRH